MIMGAAGFNYREIRMVYEDELTHCYVYLEPLGDCPIGVQGWHYKVFPKTRPGIEIFKDAVKAVEWPLAAPKAWGQH
jgi:hypothetical protein